MSGLSYISQSSAKLANFAHWAEIYCWPQFKFATGPMYAVENQYTEFVLDALRDLQPMKVGEQRRNVVVKLCSDCETCGS